MEWIGDHIFAILTTGVLAWLNGFLNLWLPSPARTWLAVSNFFDPLQPRRQDRFRIVLCWLEQDPKGDSARNVAQAFTGLDGIELVRSARMVTASGAGDVWRLTMQKKGRIILQRWDADLAVVGLVKKSSEVLTLWFVPRHGEGTLPRGDRPYNLENLTLGNDFHNDLQTEITATALAMVAPLANNKARGQIAQRGLTDASKKIATLLDSTTIGQGQRRTALQVTLGNALFVLGERESGTARLEEAIEAYRSALEERTCESYPLDRATIQNELGTALAALGRRESGTARLEEAVAAFRSALEERTRERVPLDWAMKQNNLGTALATLGERESGTTRLEEAVAAFRNALEERTRERVPLDWAMTQDNLGTALATLGERESGTTRLEEAISAVRNALEERTRESVPLAWAMTQNNLGRVLWILGVRKSDSAYFDGAVVAFRSALEELTRERIPLAWALTQHNLGNALRMLGMCKSDRAYLEEAVVAFRNALEVRTREHVPLDWAKTQNHLDELLAELGRP